MPLRDHLDLLMTQYQDSPRLKALIGGFLDVLQEELLDPATYLGRALNPNEIDGVWLDYLGARLGFTRPLIAFAQTDFFGFDGAGLGFDQAPLESALTVYEVKQGVGDNWYRSMLRARARYIRSGVGRDDLEAVLAVLFDEPATITPGTRSVEINVADSRDRYAGIVREHREQLIPRAAGFGMELAIDHGSMVADQLGLADELTATIS